MILVRIKLPMRDTLHIKRSRLMEFNDGEESYDVKRYLYLQIPRIKLPI